jgi:hypothetical protein
MYVSQETVEQTEQRLHRVLIDAHFDVYKGEFAFVEYPVDQFPSQLVANALAFVRDDDVWSALVSSDEAHAERFVVFSFHFVDGQDNSGFVGWLATHLKRAVGTGVFVICGQNSKRGGIFDYWGAPIAVADKVIEEIFRLRGR